MEIVEVVRRWQLGESQRAIARASGVARETVKKYLRAAEGLGVAANGPPPNEEQLVKLVQVGRVVSAPRTWASPDGSRPTEWNHPASLSGDRGSRSPQSQTGRKRRSWMVQLSIRLLTGSFQVRILVAELLNSKTSV